MPGSATFDHPHFGTVCLGRPTVRHDGRTLRLARYVDRGLLAKAPATCDWSKKVPTWPMYGNDRLGDCTCAAAGHMVQSWSFSAGAGKTPADADVERFYIPQTGTADDGRSELNVLQQWRKVGFGGDRVEAFAAVDPKNHAMVKLACWLFGGVYIGVALPRTAQGQANWAVVRNGGADAEPGSWGGHAVNIVGYDSRGVRLVTWGNVIRASWGFLERYMDESYAVLSRDWLGAKGSPSGFDLNALLADLKSVTA